MTENYPEGAYNDPSAPWSEPNDRDITVEVTVEIGTFVGVTVPQYKEGRHLVINEDELKEAVEEVIKDKLNIDNEDIVLNNLSICSYQ
nr:MAG TPA: hypothetical protein [Crassvirales sp.]